MIEWNDSSMEYKYNHPSRTPAASPSTSLSVLPDIAIYLSYWQWSQFSAKCNLNYLFLRNESLHCDCRYTFLLLLRYDPQMQIANYKTHGKVKLSWDLSQLWFIFHLHYSIICWTLVSLVLTKLVHNHTHTEKGFWIQLQISWNLWSNPTQKVFLLWWHFISSTRWS